MPLLKQIARFFYHQYLWKESIDILHFCVEIATKGSDWGRYFWLGVARRAQRSPNLPRLARVSLIGLGYGQVRKNTE